MQEENAQMDRLIVNDQLFKLDRLDYFRRKSFFKILFNLLQCVLFDFLSQFNDLNS